MIIQRLTSAIRHQNGSQIIIEILIVVIGIFLGLQVQSWYDGRIAKQEEGQIIDYLIADIENAVIRLESADNSFTASINAHASLLQQLEQQQLSSDEIDVFEYNLFSVGKTPPFQGYLDTLTDTNIDKIQNSIIKRIINNYLDSKNEQFILLEIVYARLNISRAPVMKKTLISEETSIGVVKFYDFESLKDDYEYKISIGYILNDMTVIQRRLKKVIEYTHTLIEILKGYQSGEKLEEVTFQ
jgi:hypothetical protein